MNIIKFPLFSFEIISHKLLKLSAPFFILACLPLNVLLLGHGGVYYVAFLAQAACYVLCITWLWRGRKGKKNPIFGFMYHFIMVNVSMLVGWSEFLSGKKSVMWNPQRQ